MAILAVNAVLKDVKALLNNNGVPSLPPTELEDPNCTPELPVRAGMTERVYQLMPRCWPFLTHSPRARVA